jgi:Fe2+ or Zn2+ uptake regulation protein
MLYPTKHENLSTNILVLGGDIISLLKKRKVDIETLYQIVKDKSDVSVDTFYNSLTFLWLADIIEVKEFHIKVKDNDS